MDNLPENIIHWLLRDLLHVAKLLAVMLLAVSCMNDELWLERNRPNLSVERVRNGNGVMIINEGNFMYGNSSLSFYDDSSREVWNDVYYRQNGTALGDVAFSAEQHNGLLYVVVNNSGKVLLLNMGKYPGLKAFEHTGKITGLVSPRHIHFISSAKAYISDLYSRSITIYNPEQQKVTGSIPVRNGELQYYQHPTEQFVQWGKYVFTNAYSYDNKVLVIDSETDRLTDSIEVLRQPSSMVLDRYGKLWVLCDGGYEGSHYGDEMAGLVRMDAATRTVEKVFPFGEDHWPSELTINAGGDSLYFINGDVWCMPAVSAALPAEALIPANGRLFYALGISPYTSDIYVGDAIDYVQSGMVYRYKSSGMLSDSFRCGISPGKFVFMK
jgi:hypothetical protein